MVFLYKVLVSSTRKVEAKPCSDLARLTDILVAICAEVVSPTCYATSISGIQLYEPTSIGLHFSLLSAPAL